jgi:O-antigen/teichoic acid export membrane protein
MRTESRLAAGLTVINYAVAVQGLVTGPLQARALGLHDRGVLASIIIPMQVVPVLLAMGTYQTATWVMSRSPHHRSESLRVLSRLSLVPAVATALASWPTAMLLLEPGQERLWLALGMLTGTVTGFVAAYSGVAEMLGDWRAVFLVRSGPPLVILLSVLVLFVDGRLTVGSVVVVFALGNLLPAVFLAVRSLRWVRGESPGAHDADDDAPAFRPALAYSMRTWLGTLTNAANARLDQLILVPVLPPESLGLYVVAVSLTFPLAPATNAVGTLLKVRAAEGRLSAAATVANRMFVCLALLGALALGLSGPWLISVLFGVEFSGAAILLWLLLPGAVALTVSGLAQNLLYGLGLPGAVFRAEFLGVVAGLGALAVLIPALEVSGAALASSLSYICTAAYLARSAAKSLGVHWTSLLVPRPEDVLLVTRQLRSHRSS